MMGKTAKKLIAFILTAAVMLSCAGCQMFFVNEEKDKTQVILSINGVEIQKSELLQYYNADKYVYGITDLNEKAAAKADDVKELKDAEFESLIKYEVLRQKAAEFGVEELSDEQIKTIDENVASLRQSAKDTITKEVDEEMADNPNLDREAEIARRLEKQLKTNGLNDDSYKHKLEREKLEENIKAYLAKDYTVSEEELEVFYENNVEAQKSDLDKNPSNLHYYEDMGVVLYVPEGIRSCKRLLVAIPADKANEISQLRVAGKEDEANAIMKEELAKIKDKAQKIYDEVMANTSAFDAMIEKYGEDEKMKDEKAKKEGLRVSADSTAYDDEFIAAAMNLKQVGDFSGLVESIYGYYIIQYTSAMEAKTYTFAETRDSFYDMVLENSVKDYYDDQVTKWIDEADVVKHRDRIY